MFFDPTEGFKINFQWMAATNNNVELASWTYNPVQTLPSWDLWVPNLPLLRISAQTATHAPGAWTAATFLLITYLFCPAASQKNKECWRKRYMGKIRYLEKDVYYSHILYLDKGQEKRKITDWQSDTKAIIELLGYKNNSRRKHFFLNQPVIFLIDIIKWC